ncbi:MAG TPA: DUF4136 domain-containing protein [Chryseolinea sp.]
MKKLAIFIFAVTACSSITVSYDYDKTVDFNKYKTYAYTEETLKLPVGDLDRDRLMKAVDAELAARGMTKSTSPDALIDLQIKAKERTEATATNTGGMYGRYGYGGGFSTTNIDYNTYVDGTLFVNLVDKASEKLVWQGRGTKTLDEHASPQKKESNINTAVKMIFAKYPVLAKK